MIGIGKFLQSFTEDVKHQTRPQSPDFFEQLSAGGPQKPQSENLSANKVPQSNPKQSITKNLLNRFIYTEQPGARAHTEEHLHESPKNIDTRLTDMLVKENRQLKQLIEQRQLEMDSLKEKTLTL